MRTVIPATFISVLTQIDIDKGDLAIDAHCVVSGCHITNIYLLLYFNYYCFLTNEYKMIRATGMVRALWERKIMLYVRV